MPWLVKGKEIPSENILFVHVPRCGGTSLMKSHNIPKKVIRATPWSRKFFMHQFFHHYELLEKVNFPIFTGSNACLLVIFSIGCALLRYAGDGYKAIAIAMVAFSAAIFVIWTFIFTAPAMSRVALVRRSFLFFLQHIARQAMIDTNYLVGTNMHGYLNHLTARKIIDNYVSREEFETVCTFAIVRNPYARMVSIYMYNRLGPCESLAHFARSWYNGSFRAYRERGEMQDWYTPSHAIPQFEYTHELNGSKKLVRSVVKIEDLKHLKTIRRAPKTVKGQHNDVGINVSKMIQVDGSEKFVEEKNNDCISSSSSSTTSSRASSESSLETDDLISDDPASTTDSLPESIRRALIETRHDNARKTKMPWYEHYDQETLNLIYKMYHRDFEIFGYDDALKERPDLERPPRVIEDKSV